ncbi:hypothetical protein HKD37_20G055263 [Glycine soja]|nr:hypothetical protein GmHk_20G056618 [Glycine max]
MKSLSPYFSSSCRCNFTEEFILDMGMHFIIGLRALVGCEVVSFSAMISHVDLTLPPRDHPYIIHFSFGEWMFISACNGCLHQIT